MAFIRSAYPHDCSSTCALEVERLDARTIGLVQRDGIQRLRHVMGYSQEDDTICFRLGNRHGGVGTARLMALQSWGLGFAVAVGQDGAGK